MFTDLDAAGKPDLAVIGYSLASFAFRRENNTGLDSLVRRFREMHDILRESPIYQEILREGREEGRERGREEGREQGREEGLQKGQLEALSQAVVDIVQERFPKLVRLTKKQVAVVKDAALLRHLIVKVSMAQDMEEAQLHLLAVDDDEDEGY